MTCKHQHFVLQAKDDRWGAIGIRLAHRCLPQQRQHEAAKDGRLPCTPWAISSAPLVPGCPKRPAPSLPTASTWDTCQCKTPTVLGIKPIAFHNAGSLGLRTALILCTNAGLTKKQSLMIICNMLLTDSSNCRRIIAWNSLGELQHSSLSGRIQRKGRNHLQSPQGSALARG